MHYDMALKERIEFCYIQKCIRNLALARQKKKE